MSTSYFYLYPDDDGPLLAVDLAECVSSRIERPAPDRILTRSADGSGWSSSTAFGYTVNLTLQAFGSAAATALERKLQLVANHLNRGGMVGFSRDHAKTWACIISAPPRAADTTMTAPGNGFASWSSAGTLAAGDEVTIETGHPENRRDILTVTSLTGTTLTLAEALRLSFRYPPLVRWRDFWPLLYTDPSDGTAAVDVVQTIGYAYTLDITLRYAPSLAYQLANGGVPGVFTAGAGSVVQGSVSPLGALGLRDATLSAGVVSGATIQGLVHPRARRWTAG